MNLLAHAYLGFDDPELIAGQIAGDFVKGRDLSAYPGAIGHGIRMHRQLDAWTDRQPAFRRSCGRISVRRRRVAGILVDLLYDHSLARSWSDYSRHELDHYAGHVYRSLAQHGVSLPDEMAAFIRRSPRIGLLEGYREQAGLERAILHIAGRFSKPDIFDGAIEEVMRIVPQIDEDFAEFFPTAIKQALKLAPNSHKLTVFGESSGKPQQIKRAIR
ncbi:MAG: DUF479 domain-containing protein [Gammaproteobacteria bacterium]|nr:DUF479 domain-containing protein [Gammaproteobacteria bacterium]